MQLERAGARIASFFPPLIQIGPLGIVQSYGLAIRTARAGCAGAIKSAGLVAIAFVGGAGTLVIAAPLGLYVLGLSNIEGRPEPPTDTNHVAAETALLQQTVRSPSPVVIHVLNPWTYSATLLTEDPKDLRADNGSSAVWLIARDYNYNHLKNRKMSYWHLSGAALTIWVSRNWTTAQVVTAAAAIARSRPKQSLPN